MCNHSIGPSNAFGWLDIVQLVWWNMLIIPDRNITTGSSLKKFCKNRSSEAVFKKTKCQKSFCCRFWQKCAEHWWNWPSALGYVNSFSGKPHPYLSSNCVSTAAGTLPAGLMMSRRTDGFCCHLEWWLPASSLSLTQSRHAHTSRMADLYIVVGWWWPLQKWHVLFWNIPICFPCVASWSSCCVFPCYHW